MDRPVHGIRLPVSEHSSSFEIASCLLFCICVFLPLLSLPYSAANSCSNLDSSSGCAKRCKPAPHSTNVSIGTNVV